MKISEAINRTDALKPNQYTPEQKMLWLSELDARIYNDILLTHEDNPFEKAPEEPTEDTDDVADDVVEEEETPMFPYTDEETTLIAEFPYDCMYISYLQAKIDEANEETQRYQNSAAMFNAQYDDYARFYNRTHMPKQVRKHYAFPLYR